MRQLIRWGAVILALLVVFGLSQTGMLASLDRRLNDWHFASTTTPVSGTTVVVEIDSKSLAEIGVWPWPRSLHARLLDQLMAANVDMVAFDIDFSSASTLFDDAIFAASLEQAGGYAILASFAQTNADGTVTFARPNHQFADLADAALVNVLLDPITGRAHSLPAQASDAQGTIPALAVELARPSFDLPEIIEVDFSLDLAALPRFSFTDVLYGRVDPSELAGKQIIVGASAIELRDFFQVPLHGVIAGPVLQALAVETLKAGRVIVDWGSLPGLGVAAFIAMIMLLRRQRAPIPVLLGILGLSALSGEALAYHAYTELDILVDTGSFHVGLVLLFGLALADDGYRHLQGRRSALQRMQYLASHDAATGLWSRQGLLEQPPPAVPLAMVLLHVPATDELRALLGHDLVQKLLSRFAKRLDHTGFSELARVAGASFAMTRRDDGDADKLAASARHLASTLCGTYDVDGHTLHIDVLAGYSAGTTSRADLLNQAETALIHARSNRLTVRGFSAADQVAMGRRRRLDRDLRQALLRGQLRLIYQPQVDMVSREIIGAETLMRWEHPELGLISPAEFIPLAEETGQIIELGRWIISEACRQAMEWPAPITVAVNVSPIQFQHDDICQAVAAALRNTGLPAHRLELEITESSRVTDPKRVHDVMWRLQKLGIQLSIDDFGTGYSSLGYFRDLPFDTVKIDQSFVRNRTAEQDIALLAAIIELSKKMGKHTVAEGVEDEATARNLAQMGCTYGQGYYFGRPMPHDVLCTRLTETASPAGLEAQA